MKPIPFARQLGFGTFGIRDQCGFASYISAVIGARMAGVGKIVGFHHGTVDNAETFGQRATKR